MDIFTPIDEPFWTNTSVHIIGGGPSLKNIDLTKLIGKGFIFAVNDSAFKCECDALFSLDTLWMTHRYKHCMNFKNKCYLAVPANFGTQHPKKVIPDAQYLIRIRSGNLCEKPMYINGTNSGYGALNLCYHKRAREVFLWGFDMNKTPSVDKAHWHDGYHWFNYQNERYYPKWAKEFDAAAVQCKREGVKVYNCNPDSAIESFEKVEPSCIL